MLVERVEGFCAEADWLRAYAEINDFEEQLVQTRRPCWCKFWLQITTEEQLRRFKERERIALQALQDHRRGLAQPREVGRLRARRLRHGRAHQTEIAPWTLVEANDKNFARIKVLKTICERIERALEEV